MSIVSESCQAPKTLSANLAQKAGSINEFALLMDVYHDFLPVLIEANKIPNLSDNGYSVLSDVADVIKSQGNPIKKAISIYKVAIATRDTRKSADDQTNITRLHDKYVIIDGILEKYLGTLSQTKRDAFISDWLNAQGSSSIDRLKLALENQAIALAKKLPPNLNRKTPINQLWFDNYSKEKHTHLFKEMRDFIGSQCLEPKQSLQPSPSWFDKNVSFTGAGSSGYGDVIAGAREDGLSFWGVLAQLKILAVITPTPNTWLRADYEGTIAYDPAGTYQDKPDAGYKLMNNNASIGLAFSARFLEEILSFYAEARYSKHYQDISTDFMPGGQAVIANLGLSASLYKKIFALQAIGTVQYEAVNFVKPFEDDKAYTQIRGTAAVGPTLSLGKKSFTALNFIAGANQIIDDPDKKLAVDEDSRKNIFGFSFFEQVDLDHVTLSLKAAYVNHDGNNYFAAQPKAFVTINKYFGFGVFCPIQTVNKTASLTCLLELRAGYPKISSADSNQSLFFNGVQAPLFIGDQLW